MTSSKRRPAAQVESAKKAATLKASNKKPQPAWLQQQVLNTPAETPLPSSRRHGEGGHRPQGPPRRLIGKAEVCAITGVSFPTIWAWMRAGKFPRSRIVGGKSMWLSSDIDAWLAALPTRRLKGDEKGAAAR